MIINLNKPEELKKKMMSRGMSDEEADAAVEKFRRAAKQLFAEGFDDGDENNENRKEKSL